MVTGASTADVAVVLLDARKGVIEQTQRHTFIAAMLGIPHVVFAVNKMDLVDFDEARFREIEAELRELTERLDLRDATTIPIAALHGDNVVDAVRAHAVVGRARRSSSSSRRSRSPATATCRTAASRCNG